MPLSYLLWLHKLALSQFDKLNSQSRTCWIGAAANSETQLSPRMARLNLRSQSWVLNRNQVSKFHSWGLVLSIWGWYTMISTLTDLSAFAESFSIVGVIFWSLISNHLIEFWWSHLLDLKTSTRFLGSRRMRARHFRIKSTTKCR